MNSDQVHDKKYWKKVRRARKRARRLHRRQERIEKLKAFFPAKLAEWKERYRKYKRRQQRKRERVEREKQNAEPRESIKATCRRHWLRTRRFFLRKGRNLSQDLKTLPQADYRHWLAILILALLVWAALSVCSLSIERLGDAFVDLKSSAVYYWQKIILRREDVSTEGLTIGKLPEIDLQRVCPFSIEDVVRKVNILGKALFTKEMFLRYLIATLDTMTLISLILPSAVVLIVAVPLLIKTLVFQHTTNRKDSKPLTWWKKHVTPVFSKIMTWLREFRAFLGKEGYLTYIFLVWFVNLNIATVVVEFLAWYLHFATGFDLSASAVSLARLLIDLLIALWSAPWWFWCIVFYVLFDAFRRDIGYDVLRHNESKNAGFFSSLAVACLIVGTMGKGKTTLLTSLGLTGQNYFRRKARALMFSLDMKFPKFPIQRFEDAIDAAYEAGMLHKMRHVSEFVQRKKRQYEACPSPHRLYGYDIEHANMSFDDALKVTELFDALEAYAKLYYLYVIRLPLLISNYSVRSDAALTDKGNFPNWSDDFFEKSPRESEDDQEYSHILDMDTMRLGKLMNPEDEFRGSKDIGIVMITEMGKERGNMLEHKGMKKEADTANPLNDRFNDRVKMDRHAALIENFSFTKILGDEQREESLGADARELADIVKIREKSDPKLAMPCYALGQLIYTLFGSKFENLYYEYRYERGDQTLFGYAMKNLFCLFYHHHMRIMNTFGYHVLTLEVASGKGDEQGELFKYYIAYKKDYSGRFKSDGFADAFDEQSKLTETGLVDYPQFKGIKSTVNEMGQMNSYFANMLIEMMNMVAEDQEESSENSTKGS